MENPAHSHPAGLRASDYLVEDCCCQTGRDYPVKEDCFVEDYHLVEDDHLVGDDQLVEDDYLEDGQVMMESEYRDLTPQDTVIAVMGVTGVGKSTFISHFNKNAEVGESLTSQTSRVEIHKARIDGKTIFLIDTPGFDDTNISDIDVLRMLADWLGRAHQANILLTGIIYLHRIGDSRIQGSALKNIRTFRKLCGDEALSRVVLATTMWDAVPPHTAKRRENELATKSEFWGGMIERGSQLLRQDNGKVSALHIIRTILSKRNPIELSIQEEMASGKTLDETAAGIEIEKEISKMRTKHQEELSRLQQEWQEAYRVRDIRTQSELAVLKAALEATMQGEEEKRERLRVNLEELQQQRHEEYTRSFERLQQQRDEEYARKIEQAHAHEISRIEQLERQKALLNENELQSKLAMSQLERELAKAGKNAAELKAKYTKLREKQKRLVKQAHSGCTVM